MKKNIKKFNNKVIKKNIIQKEAYEKLLETIKADILETQLKTTLGVCKELILLYWRIGKILCEKFNTEEWGSKIVEKLARDLEITFPGINGFSLRNLRYMRKFAEVYVNEK